MPEALIRRYGAITVPRYTSYPTAADFSAGVGADRYARWISAIDPAAPVSLYVHIPYCRTLCLYCGCHAKMVIRDEVLANYRAFLEQEIRMVGARLRATPRVTRLHWGGGTPSVLESQGLVSVLETLSEFFVFDADMEHAIELDPRSVTRALAHDLGALGINRVSLGVQDLDPGVQEAIGRIQPLDVVTQAVAALRDAGIAAINFDLMYGLPLQTVTSAARTAAQVIALSPSRVSVFGYAHLPQRRANQRRIDETTLPDAAGRFAQSRAIAEQFVSAGYTAIGFDHFALPDDRLALAARTGTLHRNFQGYTDDDNASLIGFGASSISRLEEGYAQNVADTTAYSRAIREGRLATVRGHAFSESDRARAAVIDRLMCQQEVDLDTLGIAEPFVDELALLRPLCSDGILSIDRRRIAITDRGRPFVRLVASVFDAYLPAASGGFSPAI